MLESRNLSVFYGRHRAVENVSVTVSTGEIVVMLGANGAGKSTFLRAVAGALPVPPSAVELDGQPVGGRPSPALVGLGVVLVPEGRRIFPSLTVRENLLVGAYRGRPGPWTVERVSALFPILGQRRDQPGTNLSGGEQQMLAVGRGLMANPRLLLVDEISLGLAPLVVRTLYRALEAVKAEGTTLIVVEQDVSQVLAVAQRVYCFRKGAVALEGVPARLTREQISAAYFGT
jgi:branched-chain amino acid transport system ATP-binding protein